jgi:hypothetical protein
MSAGLSPVLASTNRTTLLVVEVAGKMPALREAVPPLAMKGEKGGTFFRARHVPR